MSISLVLGHYLSGLKERNELDALLPELLRAMGHSVESRPQTGVAQAGVDVVSVAKNDEGAKEVFLFVIKFGDVGREDFYSGRQSVEPSIREAANDFARNRLTEQQKKLKKRIVLLTNGALKQEVQAGFSALSEDIAGRGNFTLEFWGADHLTPLIEEYLFDEALLLKAGKSDLRASIAGIEDTEASTRRFVRFLDNCFDAASSQSTPSPKQRRPAFLRRMASASMGWVVLLAWGRSEGNLKPGVLAGEYLLLRLWSEAVNAQLTRDKEVNARLTSALLVYVNALYEYFEKIGHQLATPRVLAGYRPERVFYADLVFEELGRCAELLLLLQRIEGTESQRAEICNFLVALANQHPGCRLPFFDGQSIDLSLVLVALLGEGAQGNATTLVADVVNRLARAVSTGRGLPIDTDLIEDAISLLVDKESEPREFFKTSTLVPMLAAVASLIGDNRALKDLRENILPRMKEVTLERWYPLVALETLTGSDRRVQNVGASRALAGIQKTAKAEAMAATKLFEGVAAAKDFQWHRTPWDVFILLSARMHRHPVPTWVLAEYATSARKASAISRAG